MDAPENAENASPNTAPAPSTNTLATPPAAASPTPQPAAPTALLPSGQPKAGNARPPEAEHRLEQAAQQVDLIGKNDPDSPLHYVALARYFGTAPQVVAAFPAEFKLRYAQERYDALLQGVMAKNFLPREGESLGNAAQEPTNSGHEPALAQFSQGNSARQSSSLWEPLNPTPNGAPVAAPTMNEQITNATMPDSHPSSISKNATYILSDEGTLDLGSHGAPVAATTQKAISSGTYAADPSEVLNLISQYREAIKSAAAEHSVNPQAIASILFQEKLHGIWADLKDVPAVALAATSGTFGNERSIGLAEMKVSRAATLLGLDASDENQRLLAVETLLTPSKSIDLLARNIAAYQTELGRPLTVREATVAHNAGSKGLRSHINGEIPEAKIGRSVYGRSWNYQAAIAEALQGKLNPVADAKR